MKLAIEAGLAASPRPTGVEYYARNLLEAVAQVGAPEDEVHAYLPPQGGPELSTSKVRLHRRPDLNTQLKTPWLCARTWLDRISVIYSFGLWSSAWARGRKAITVYDLIFKEFPDCYFAGIPEQLDWQLRAVLPRCSAVAVCSKATEEALRRHYAYQGLTIVLGGAARSVFAPGPPEPLKGPLSEIHRPFFLSVGRLDRRKNIPTLVRAYRRLVSEGHACDLVLVGPQDSGSDELQSCLSESSVPGERIWLPGYVTEPELLALYRSALGFVFPSLAEGFGLPILEALACRTPVICAGVSAMKEFADRGTLTVSSPLEPAAWTACMQQLLEDENLRNTLAEQGLQHSRNFSWKVCAERLLQGLRALV